MRGAGRDRDHERARGDRMVRRETDGVVDGRRGNMYLRRREVWSNDSRACSRAEKEDERGQRLEAVRSEYTGNVERDP
jgi:hypothetical protein